jgi:hypothetical protein
LYICPDCEGTIKEYSYRSWFYFSVETEIKNTIKFVIKNLNNQRKLFADGYKICYKKVYNNEKDDLDNNYYLKWRRLENKIDYEVKFIKRR